METPKFKILLAAAVAGTGLLLASSSAHAAATTDFATLIAYNGGALTSNTNQLTDADGESLIKGTGNTAAGTIEAGDYIFGVLDFNRISNVNNGAPGTAIGAGTIYSELTAVFLLKVTSKTAAAGGTFNFTFGPDTAMFDTQLGLPAGTLSSGTMIRAYDDFSQDFKIGGTGVTQASSVASATDGTHFLDAGFTGPGGTAGAGQGWAVFGGSDNFGVLGTVGNSSTLGTSNFGINLTNLSGFGTGLNLLGQNSVFFGFGAQFEGSSTIKGVANSGIAWGANSQTNIDFVAVPIPTAALMSLPMLGLMAGAAVLRRRRAQHATL
jgi:hypothetical protein